MTWRNTWHWQQTDNRPNIICSNRSTRDFRHYHLDLGMAPAPGIMNTGTSDPTRRYHPASNLEPHDFRVHTRKFRVPECMRKPFSIPSLVLCPTWDDSTASSSPAPTRHNATSPRLPPFPIMTIHQCPIPAQLDYFQYRLPLELQFLQLMMCYCDLSRPRFMFYNNQDAL